MVNIWEDFKELFQGLFPPFFLFISIVSIITLFIFGCKSGYEYMSCKKSANIMKKEYHYDIFAGCFLKDNETWINNKSVREQATPIKIF